MKTAETMRILRVKEVVSFNKYVAEDVFTGETFPLSGHGKLLMNGVKPLGVGDECVAVPSHIQPGTLRQIISTNLKGTQDNTSWKALGRLTERYASEIGTYEVDEHWVKRSFRS